MTAIARRLDATEGQVWSLAVGFVVAVVLAVVGIPPVVHHRTLVASTPVVRAARPAITARPAAPVPSPAEAMPATPPTVLVTAPVDTSAPADAAGPALPLTTAVAGAGVAVAAAQDGAVFVADGDRIAVLDDTGSRVRDLPGSAAGLALDGATLVATDADRVERIDLGTGHRTIVATIPDLPSCVLAPAAPACEPGLEDHRPRPGAVAVAGQDIYVADAAQATVWRIHAGQPAVWSSSLAYAAGGGPAALAVASDGSVLVAVPTDVTPANPGGATLERVVAGGAPTPYATFERGADPSAIAVLPDGRVAVALRGAHAVAVLDGASVRRIAIDAIGVASGPPGELVVTAPGRVVRMSSG